MFGSGRGKHESNTGASESNTWVSCIASDFSTLPQISLWPPECNLLTARPSTDWFFLSLHPVTASSNPEVCMHSALCQSMVELVVAPDTMTELVRGEEESLVQRV